MHRALCVTALSLIAAGTVKVPRAAAGDGQTDVPVRKVVLFSSGVGYFEHTGTVSGNASTELRFKSAQINDILKSLVLEDLDRGRVGTVVYPSQDPLAKTLRSFQVDISGNPPLGELLNQLRGARVTVTAHGEQLSGAILGLEMKDKPVGEKGSVKVWVLNLISGGTIRALELEAARTIELEDAQLQEELTKALLALAQARDQDKKPVTINFKGQGDRRVRLGYVVETPIWKTTYRLIMPEGKEKIGKLQGWALVENQTESDWNDVALSLVSGRPISFVQNLYQPLYVPRPVVEPELYASLTPQAYGAGMDLEERKAALFGGGGRGGGGVAGFAQKEAPQAPPLRQLRAKRRRGQRGVAEADDVNLDGLALGEAYAVQPAFDAAASVSSLATAAEMGELFQYTVSRVSLPRQRSAMIPIITDDIAVERVSIYNQRVLPKNPLNGALVTNTTDKHLLQGPLTVLDDHSYAGDARIEDLPPGQHRLLSYAVDLDVHVNATKTREQSWLQTGKVVKGILHLKRKQVFKQEYVIDNKSDKDRTIVVEHPFRPGWKLVDTPEPFETTDRLHRFRDAVAAGEQSKLTVSEERIRSETIAILPADISQIQHYSRAGEIPAQVRQALARAIELKSAVVDTERKINERRGRIRDITAEQDRIRKNMKTVSSKSEYYARLLGKLDDQETVIESLQSEIERLQKTLNKQRAALENYLMNLNVA